jgi:LmbE family N-acetylglucosaminyl deacetylase
MTDGEGARGSTTADVSRRKAACEAAAQILGAEAPVQLDFPDNAMDTVPRIDVVQAIEAELARFEPEFVYTHHAQDLNIDHRITHEAVITALRPQPHAPRPTILAFEVMSSTEWQAPAATTAFIPNWYVDISAFLETKKAALLAYCDEMRPWPHSRSIEALEHLSRWRGACVGVAAAEAFSLIRKVSKS